MDDIRRASVAGCHPQARCDRLASLAGDPPTGTTGEVGSVQGCRTGKTAAARSEVTVMPSPLDHWELSADEQAYVGRLARRMMHRACLDLVDDCLVEARLAAWRAAERIAGGGIANPPGYRRCAMRRAIIRYLCRVRAQQPMSPEGTACEPPENLPAPDVKCNFDPQSDLCVQVEDERLPHALGRSATADHEILLLCYGRELTDAEAAVALGINRAAATKRRQRAEARLRRLLSGADAPTP